MDVENEFIKPIVLSYYNKGLSEVEACKEISKKYGQYGITTRTISKWYKRLKPEEDDLDKKPAASTNQISDEFLIDLVENNPGLNMTELGKLAGTATSVISAKLKEIIRNGGKVNYKHKSRGNPKKFTDEFLINLANENPGISVSELSSLAGASVSAVSKRIDKINSTVERIKIKSGKTSNRSNFTDEFLINLVNENPKLTMQELGKLVGVTASTISLRLSNIRNKEEKLDFGYENSKSSISNEGKKSKSKITKQQIIDLINGNPDLNVAELAKLANVSTRTISNQLKNISVEDMKINYDSKNSPHKHSNDLTCSLANYNPDLNLEEQPEISDTSARTLSKRLNQINIDEKMDDCGEKKKVQKTFAYFSDEFLIDLVNNNPDLNMTELGILAGTSASTISMRLKEINSDGERVKYKHKSKGKSKTFSDEFLINLANENPGISIKELSSLAGASISVVSNQIKQINICGERIKIKSGKTGKQPAFTDEFLINLVNENPELTMQELGKLVGVSTATISLRLKKINHKGEMLKYSYKDCKHGISDKRHPKTPLTKQRVIDLINENPELNMAELAKLVNVSTVTISNYIKKINSGGGKVNYIYKY